MRSFSITYARNGNIFRVILVNVKCIKIYLRPDLITKQKQIIMNTTQSNDLRHNISVDNSTGNYLIKIRLNDECKNGHQDFSITATFWEIGKVRNDRNMVAGGCCHEEILNVRPDLQIFVNLHLCDYSGVPLYAVENGFYHLTNGFNGIPATAPEFASKFCQYYRVTEKQFSELVKCENKLRYAVALDRLGVLNQWKEEANKAIEILENWTEKTFVMDSKKTQYYSPEKIRERQIMAETEAKQKQYDSIRDDMDSAIDKAKLEYDVKKAVLDAGLSLENFIFYNHTKKGLFNWLDYKKRVQRSEFENFVSSVKIDGVTFEIQ